MKKESKSGSGDDGVGWVLVFILWCSLFSAPKSFSVQGGETEIARNRRKDLTEEMGKRYNLQYDPVWSLLAEQVSELFEHEERNDRVRTQSEKVWHEALPE